MAAKHYKIKSHGHCRNNGNSPTYKSWASMIQRCSNPKTAMYKYYGGRGIHVCDEWLSFSAFLRDMGQRPSGTTLDRKDGALGYCKDNCQWSTHKRQIENRSNTKWIEFNGERKTISGWASHLGIKQQTLRYRFYYGWSIEKALTGPLHHTR